jgi:serine protease Do
MTPDQYTLEQIDRYLAGAMDSNEHTAFEQRLAGDKVLQHQVEEQRHFLNLVQQAAIKAATRKSMASLQKELDTKTVGKIISFSYWQDWTRKHGVQIAIAASVAVLAVMTTVSILASTGFLVQKQKTTYQVLQREMEDIRRSQKKIISDINSGTTTEVQPADYAGTAVAISPEGYVITSYHMVKNARRIVLENKTLGAFAAEKWVTNPALDLAILKVDSATAVRFLNMPIAISHRISGLGEEVYTMGFPREDLVYGHGSISAMSGFNNDTTAYQISIPVNPGNSGGPLFDSQGNLVGLISGKNIRQEGTAFAIKADRIAEYLATLEGSLAFKVSKKNQLKGMKRTDQISRAEPYVFMVKVYK